MSGRNSKKKVTRRSQKGAIIAEGAISLGLIVISVLAGCALLINSGLVTFYKQKLSIVANRAAADAVETPTFDGAFREQSTDGDIERRVSESVNFNLRALGLPEASSILVNRTGKTLSVTVAIEDLPLISIGEFSFMPTTLIETGVAATPENLPPGVLTLSLGGQSGSTMVTVPCYGKFIDGFSNGTVPPDAAPPGTALFLNRPRGSYSQFSMTMKDGGGFSETLATQRQ